MANMIVFVFTILVIADVIEGVISVLTQFQLAKPMSWRMIDDRLILRFHQQTVSVTQSNLPCFLVLYAEYAWIGVKGIISGSAYIETGILVVAYGQAWQQYAHVDGRNNGQQQFLIVLVEGATYIGRHAKTDAQHGHSLQSGMGLGEEEYQHRYNQHPHFPFLQSIISFKQMET